MERSRKTRLRAAIQKIKEACQIVEAVCGEAYEDFDRMPEGKATEEERKNIDVLESVCEYLDDQAHELAQITR